MRQLLFLLFILIAASAVYSQDVVNFETTDGLMITGDQYEVDVEYPYIIFCHQANSSRGEYKETARKFLNLGYNCLAIDLRSGDEELFVANETAALAKKKNLPTKYIDAEKDILAAIQFLSEFSDKPFVLFGSSYSASLCLKIAMDNDKVSAVVAFSPGEFLLPDFNVKEGIKGFSKPVLAACSQREFKYLEDMFSGVDTKYKKLFSPKGGPGDHGAKSLWKACHESREYWWELNLFFKKL